MSPDKPRFGRLEALEAIKTKQAIERLAAIRVLSDTSAPIFQDVALLGDSPYDISRDFVLKRVWEFKSVEKIAATPVTPREQKRPNPPEQLIQETFYDFGTESGIAVTGRRTVIFDLNGRPTNRLYVVMRTSDVPSSARVT